MQEGPQESDVSACSVEGLEVFGIGVVIKLVS